LYNDHVLDKYDSDQPGSYYAGNSRLTLQGYPINNLFSYKWGGLDKNTGNPIGFLNGVNSMDYNLITGQGTSIEDLVYHGSSVPTIYGNLGNAFRWKNITINMRLSFFMNYYFFKEAINYEELIRVNSTHYDFNS